MFLISDQKILIEESLLELKKEYKTCQFVTSLIKENKLGGYGPDCAWTEYLIDFSQIGAAMLSSAGILLCCRLWLA
jgi:hypothetical protein